MVGLRGYRRRGQAEVEEGEGWSHGCDIFRMTEAWGKHGVGAQAGEASSGSPLGGGG